MCVCFPHVISEGLETTYVTVHVSQTDKCSRTEQIINKWRNFQVRVEQLCAQSAHIFRIWWSVSFLGLMGNLGEW